MSSHLLQRQACRLRYRPSLIHDAAMMYCRVVSIMFLLRSLSNANYICVVNRRVWLVHTVSCCFTYHYICVCVFTCHHNCVDLEEIICIALIFVISLDGFCAAGEPLTLFVCALLGARRNHDQVHAVVKSSSGSCKKKCG